MVKITENSNLNGWSFLCVLLCNFKIFVFCSDLDMLIMLGEKLFLSSKIYEVEKDH